MSEWSERIEPALRRQAYRTIDSDPQILLETDGGPAYIDADLIFARLIGFEDEIVRDGLQLRRAEPTILLPIPARPLWQRADAESVTFEMEPSRTARYELQSGFATMRVDAQLVSLDLPLRPDQTVIVAYLRYRRRD